MHKLPQPVKVWYYCPMFRYEKPAGGPLPGALPARRRGHRLGRPGGRRRDRAPAGHHARRAGRRRACALLINSMGDAELPAGLRGPAARVPARARGGAVRRLPRAHGAQPLAHLRLQGRHVPRGARRGAAHQRQPVPGLPRSTSTRCSGCCAPPACSPSSISGWCAAWTTTRAPPSSSNPIASGAQNAVGGGGRYDGLVEQLGGPPTPGVGFGSGLERISIAMAEQAPPRRAARRVRGELHGRGARRGLRHRHGLRARRPGRGARSGRAQRQGPAQAGRAQRRARRGAAGPG